MHDDERVGLMEEIDASLTALAERDKSGASDELPRYTKEQSKALIRNGEAALREIDLALARIQGASA